MSAASRARVILALLAVVMGFSPAAWGGWGALDVTVERLRMPTFAGTETFLVEAPDAARSAASRVNEDLAGKDGAVPGPTPGYELTSAVIVRMRDAGAAPAVGREGVIQDAFESLPGYWRLTAGTVREAAALAVALRGEAGVAEAYLELRTPQPLRTLPPDPNVPLQWHLRNEASPGIDLNPVPAWKAGFTGAGITVGIIEDGWHITHPDLSDNFHSAASQAGTSATGHGTSVAGCVAAVAGNGIGGVGIAYGARVSRLYRGTNGANAAAFLFRNDLNGVKNNSWGPLDNGRVSLITSVERDALAQSVASGRGGLGTVHVWAAGNGGGVGDRVDYDPYASSRYTIAVGAIMDNNVRASYNESGSSMVVVAHSSGGFSDPNRGIATTSGTSGYTTGFGGTSASAPLAAGVVAMMLQARPQLSWRDVQHVLIRSARRCDPGSPGWEENGAGLAVSYDYGFGAVDAAAAVDLARVWRLVGPEVGVDAGARMVQAAIPDNDPAGVADSVVVTGDVRLEAVEVELTASHPYIGDLRIELTGPSGTRSLLARARPDPGTDYNAYTFTTVRHWGERGAGTWTLHVADEAAGGTGTWVSWRLRLYGTAVCAADWNDDTVVNSADITAFLTSWLASVHTGVLDGDFNGDGAVNSADVTAFLSAWLRGIAGDC